MCKFDSRSRAQYLNNLGGFLRLNKKTFKSEFGLVTTNKPGRFGSLSYSAEAVLALENAVNAKALRSEAADSTFAERLLIAQDYAGITNTRIAQELGISTAWLRQCLLSQKRPQRLFSVDKLLDVPLIWLKEGGEQHLPANSHLGVRVGSEAGDCRERLFTMTQALVSELPDGAIEQYVQSCIEDSVMAYMPMSIMARRAGGRWQLVNNELSFAPWVCPAAPGLTRRFWNDEVETIIDEELQAKPSVYGAWKSIKERCNANGFAYPKKISLYKRQERKREQVKLFGINFAVNAQPRQ